MASIEDPIGDIRIAIGKALEVSGYCRDPKGIIDAAVDCLPDAFRQPLYATRVSDRIAWLGHEAAAAAKSGDRVECIRSLEAALQLAHLWHRRCG